MKRRRELGRRRPTLRKLYLALGYGLALSSVPALLLLGVYAFLQLAQVSVERVVFTGDVPRAAQSELETLVNENLHGGFLSVDIERIQDSLHSHPWVFKAVVKPVPWRYGSPNRLPSRCGESTAISTIKVRYLPLATTRPCPICRSCRARMEVNCS